MHFLLEYCINLSDLISAVQIVFPEKVYIVRRHFDFHFFKDQKTMASYVGFANLPNQVHRKSVKKGFEFTLMVVGEFSGLFLSTNGFIFN